MLQEQTRAPRFNAEGVRQFQLMLHEQTRVPRLNAEGVRQFQLMLYEQTRVPRLNAEGVRQFQPRVRGTRTLGISTSKRRLTLKGFLLWPNPKCNVRRIRFHAH